MGEAIISRRGGGGAGLDGLIPIFFQNTAPTTDKIGAIWVKTASSPAGRILISYDVPPSPPWANGDFWLRTFTGTADIANLEIDLTLKKTKVFATKGTNPWQVYNGKNVNLKMKYPNNALYRENGKWVAKEAYYWSGSSWVLLTNGFNYLYNSGISIVPFVDGHKTSGTIDYLSDSIYFSMGSSSTFQYCFAVTDNLIDLTGVKKVNIEWMNAGSGSNNRPYGYITSVKNNTIGGEYHVRVIPTGTDRHVTSMDCSTLTGGYYITFGGSSGSSSSLKLYVYNVWLEY